MADSKPSLFSSFIPGRATKSPRGSETLAHPLLGASTSSLNLSAPTSAATGPSGVDGADGLDHAAASPSVDTVGAAAGSDPTLTSPSLGGPSSPRTATGLPYKAREPRQRHGHTNSASSIATQHSLHASSASVGLGISTSPAAATSGPAPPTTSTSTSTGATFALSPPSDDSLGGASGLASSVFGSSSMLLAGGAGGATSRLQLQSMKASAQKLGLGNGSLGMNMIDTVFDKVAVGRRTAEGEWGEVLKVLSGGKVRDI